MPIGHLPEVAEAEETEEIDHRLEEVDHQEAEVAMRNARQEEAMSNVSQEAVEEAMRAVVAMREEEDKPTKEPRDHSMRAHGSGNIRTRSVQF